jgi:hypothetical protein
MTPNPPEEKCKFCSLLHSQLEEVVAKLRYKELGDRQIYVSDVLALLDKMS